MKNNEIYTIEKIKELALPIFKKYNINSVYLFGSYATKKASAESDIDFFCYEKGNVTSYFVKGDLKSDLEKALGKDCDIIFPHENNIEFVKSIEGTLIKLF